MNTSLPDHLRAMLATREIRWFHHLWHFVRNEDAWNSLTVDERNELIDLGWQPPRFEQQAGAGHDFLFMHRQMIEMVNAFLMQHPSPDYEYVEAWDPIPFGHDDAVWPMPSIWANASNVFVWAKDPSTTAHYQGRSTQEFRNPAWLRQQTLDQLGNELEWSIHGWMHLHWANEPTTDPFDDSPTNDWLAQPFSSHVNDIFWKLHGWIDERIADWETATGQPADFSQAWAGAPGVLPGMDHSADERAFRAVRPNARPLRLMTWKVPIVEGVNKQEMVIREVPRH